MPVFVDIKALHVQVPFTTDKAYVAMHMLVTETVLPVAQCTSILLTRLLLPYHRSPLSVSLLPPDSLSTRLILDGVINAFRATAFSEDIPVFLLQMCKEIHLWVFLVVFRGPMYIRTSAEGTMGIW